MRTATTLAGLGDGRQDGEEAFITLSDDGIPLTWRDDFAAWRSPAVDTFKLHSTVPLRGQAVASAWKYLYIADGNSGTFNRSDFGWDPVAIRNAGPALAAGLVLQEKIDAVFTSFAGANASRLATVLYPFDQGSQISGAINPNSYVSTIIESTDDATQRHWQTSEWQDSPLTSMAVGSNAILASHLYTYHVTGNHSLLYALKITARWIGRP